MKPKLIDKANDVTEFASKGSTRYVLQSVHFRENCVEATNGWALIRVPYAPLEVGDFPPVAGVTDELADNALVPVGAFKEALSKVSKKASLPVLATVRVSSSGDKVQFATTDLDTERVTMAKVIEGTYPNTDNVIPQEAPKFSITLSASLLGLVVDYVLKHGLTTATSIPIRLDFTDNLRAVRFTVPLADKTRTAIGILMPMQMS